jgi:YrbI family 3-deoxy-D-manno-octulosonate 8-phosphate phosphatase
VADYQASHNLQPTSHRKICALVLDIDGVLTDGRVVLDQQGQETKSLCYRDIDAVFQAHREGLLVALVTGEQSPMVDIIARRLAISTVVAGAKDKRRALQEVCTCLDITLDQVCYVGDSDRDAPALAQVGLGLAPADASPQAGRSSHRVLASRGGYGAVTEALMLIHCLNTVGQEDPEAVVSHSNNVTAVSPALRQSIVGTFAESIAVKQTAVDTLPDRMALAAAWIADTLRAGHKLLLFGHAYSIALIQHIAAEFVGHLAGIADGLLAIALSAKPTVSSGHDNGSSTEMIFASQVESLGQPGDLTLALSTDGNAPDVVHGAIAARARGLRVIGLTGQEGGGLVPLCDLALCVPSTRPYYIQECHMAICHAICEAVAAMLVARADMGSESWTRKESV